MKLKRRRITGTKLEINNIYNMDCIEGMKRLKDNSIDSIVTDPPYEIGFMGKSWDSTGIAYNIDMWKECLRVLKPGGHLLSFGGSRTYHHMACAIEDAGFEIRDQIMWVYGSGFPKSYNVAKGIEGLLTNGSSNTKDYKLLNKKNIRTESTGFHKMHFEQGARPADYGDNVKFDLDATTTEANKWNGWGTSLKPAHEPIVVARKPLSEKTVAENVLKWGTGGINIDGCRIETTDNLNGGAYSGGQRCDGDWKDNSGFKNDNLTGQYVQPTGRFPANIIFDEEAGVILDEQSGKVSYGNKSGGYSYEGKEYEVEGFVKSCKPKAPSNYGDSGGASRFFYCAKSSKKERGEGNNHPTVKPIALIKYLITLVTPPNGIVLDPFVGSGTTSICAKELGFNYIGFDSDEDYCEIAKKRIVGV